MDRERECIRCGGYVSRSNYSNRLCYKCEKDLGRSSSYVPVDNTPWWETGWVWFWLIVFPIVGVYGLFKRYPKGMWYFIGFAIVIRLFQLLFEWVKGLFD